MDTDGSGLRRRGQNIHRVNGSAAVSVDMTREADNAFLASAGTTRPAVTLAGFDDEFVALDYETANSRRGSPCAVGLAVAEQGRVARSENWLMRPPDGVDWFDDFNTAIHGITPEMVKGAPRFGDILPDVLAVVDGRPVVAHNAAFDVGVTRDACDLSGMPWPTFEYLCSMVAARAVLDLESYRLPVVADDLDVVLAGHHRAEADAVCAAEVMLALCARVQAPTLAALAETLRLRWGRTDPGGWRGCRKRPQTASGRDVIPDANPDADPGNPFYGKGVALTGKLPGDVARKAAMGMIAELGGRPASSVSKKTDYLVIGDWDPRTLRPDAAHSRKYDQALLLRGKGHRIEMMDGCDFLALLQEAYDQQTLKVSNYEN